MFRIRIPSQFAKWSGMVIYHNWFHKKPLATDAFKFSQYYHCQSLQPIFGFRRRQKFTILIDLTIPEESIFNGFSETTRYKVRRASRENIRFEVVTDLMQYCDFVKADPVGTLHYWPYLWTTRAMDGDDTLVMHSYIFDQEIGRAALYQSVSSYHFETDSGKRNFIGRANRWLHYQDMLLFKQSGAKIYDFGGFAKGTTNVKLAHINQFKEGFGGSVVEESNYVSNVVILWNRIIRRREVST